MNQTQTGQLIPAQSFLTTIVFLLLFSMSASVTAADSVSPGNYCPDSRILLVSAEELSASLKLIMRSQNAFRNNDKVTAVNALTSAGATLQLAASRGASARTNLLIDAIIQAKQTEDYSQMLVWFPLLQKSMQTMTDNTKVNAASQLISRTKTMLEGNKTGDPLQQLLKARHILACDALDIPLQQAIKAQEKLLGQLHQKAPKPDYDSLLKALQTALSYTLGNKT